MPDIVSGGQTGVDRGALDAALSMGVACGGWCPPGRRAEDGRIPMRYPLRECSEAGYAIRTQRNVEDSDATCILALGPLSGGTALTADLAQRSGKPLLVVDLAEVPAGKAGRQAAAFVRLHTVKVLNVAGPRASEAPAAHSLAREAVIALIQTSHRESPDA